MQALQYFATLTVLGGAGQNDATGKHSACGGDLDLFKNKKIGQVEASIVEN
jgi:hypothetical protein